MYQLLHPLPTDSSGGVYLPQWERVREGLRNSVSKVIDFRRSNPKPLDGNHLLVRLLDNINVSKSLPLEIFHDKVIDTAFDITSSLKTTSGFHHGKVFSPGYFYGENVNEIVITTIESYDFNQMKTNWRAMRPIRALYHPFTDLTLGVPDGKTRGTEGGPAVVVINIPMLAAQYKMWVNEEQKTSQTSPRSTGQFLQQYPLPNMLYSHVDITIINRLISIYFDTEMPKPKNPHSIFLIDWQEQTDAVLSYWLDYMVKKRNWSFDSLITDFPTVFSSDFHKVIKLPEGSYSRQIQWAVVIARLALVTFLVSINKASGNEVNGLYLSRLRIYLKQMDLDKIIKTAMDRQRYDEIMVLIENGIRPNL